MTISSQIDEEKSIKKNRIYSSNGLFFPQTLPTPPSPPFPLQPRRQIKTERNLNGEKSSKQLMMKLALQVCMSKVMKINYSYK